MSNVLILSADPGKENFSVCIQNIEQDSVEIVYEELLQDRITSLLDSAEPSFNDQLDLFSCHLESLLKKYQPKNVSMERYQLRGFVAAGAVAEVINVMIGAFCLEARKQNIPTRLIVASQWKNDFNRKSEISLEQTYKLVKKLPEHCVDSMLIGWYCNKVPQTFYTVDFLTKALTNLKQKFEENKNCVK